MSRYVTWTDIYGNTFKMYKEPKRGAGKPRIRPPKNPNAPPNQCGRPPDPPRPKPVSFRTRDSGQKYHMTKGTKKQQEKGLRDERGVRVLAYKNLRDDGNETGETLHAMYVTAMENMKKLKQGELKTKYPNVEALQTAIQEYWEYLDDANSQGIALIPDTEGICSFLGISRETFRQWERDDFNGFGETLTQVRTVIAACKKQLGLQNKIPAIVMAMDFNNNHGYVQKQEVQLTPTNPLGEATKTPELAARYMDLIEGEFEEINGELDDSNQGIDSSIYSEE